MFSPPLSSPAQPQPATTIWQSQTDVSRPSSSPSSWPPSAAAAAAAARELTQAEKVILISFALFFSCGGVGRRRRELARQGRGDQKKEERMDLLCRPYPRNRSFRRYNTQRRCCLWMEGGALLLLLLFCLPLPSPSQLCGCLLPPTLPLLAPFFLPSPLRRSHRRLPFPPPTLPRPPSQAEIAGKRGEREGGEGRKRRPANFSAKTLREKEMERKRRRPPSLFLFHFGRESGLSPLAPQRFSAGDSFRKEKKRGWRETKVIALRPVLSLIS